MTDQLTKDFMRRVVKIMDERDLSPGDVIRGVGIAQPTFSQWKTNKIRISASNRQKVAKFFNLPVEYLETGIQKREYNTPVLINDISDLTAFAVVLKNTQVNPGLHTLAEQTALTTEECLERYNCLKNSHYANIEMRPALYAWSVKNDGMTSVTAERSYPNGSQVIFDPREEPKQGQCIMAVVENRLCFRRWAEVDGVQHLTLLNPAYAEGSAIRHHGSIWEIWAGTPIGYSVSF
ncbi:XRE family transcriptional regulator [Endozoicomonas sp. Mp262]|uniref:S24 family peptidase n=1 Tax=Endozoicomonas sp. Mp262 TaxID=2919499 RepID=UPI0021D7DD5E